MATQYNCRPHEILYSYADDYLLDLTIFTYGRYVDNKLQERTKDHKQKYKYSDILNERSYYQEGKFDRNEREKGRNATADSLRKLSQIPGIKIDRE